MNQPSIEEIARVCKQIGDALLQHYPAEVAASRSLEEDGEISTGELHFFLTCAAVMLAMKKYVWQGCEDSDIPEVKQILIAARKNITKLNDQAKNQTN